MSSLPVSQEASQCLISKGIVRDTPRSVAKFLKEQSGLSKMKIGEFIGVIRYEFNMAAVLEYVCRMNGRGWGGGGGGGWVPWNKQLEQILH